MTPINGDEILRFRIDHITAVMLRFHPIEWNNWICLRVELYSCVKHGRLNWEVQDARNIKCVIFK